MQIARLMAIATVLAVTLGISAAAEAQSPPNKCDSTKLKCMSKKASCLLKVYEKALKKGELPETEKLDKCKAKFDDPMKGCVAKVEAKQNPAKPSSVCTVVGNAASMETIVDDFVALALSGIVTGGVANPTPTPVATPAPKPTGMQCFPDGAFCGEFPQLCCSGLTCTEVQIPVCTGCSPSDCDFCATTCASTCANDPFDPVCPSCQSVCSVCFTLGDTLQCL